MENKVLQKNLGEISRYDKKLVDKILMFNNEKSNLAFVETQQNEYNLVLNGFPLHSQNGAIQEAQKIVKNIQNIEKKESIRLVYGLGLGYLLDEMASKIEEAKIILYEPNIEVLKTVLSVAQIDAIKKNNVIICQDREKFIYHIKNNLTLNTDITMSFLNSYKNIYQEDIEALFNDAQKILGEFLANINTMTHKAPLAVKNSIYNLKTIFRRPNISDLTDIYKGKIALCLSAGPSLKDNIDIIKNNQDKFVIFAVNPTVKLLVQNGIKPDFIVNIEAYDTSMQFSTINPKEYYFILEGFCSCPVMNLETKKTFNYLSNNNFLNPFMRDCLKLNDNLETCGTVSYSALLSAYVMGFKKIVVCGQDLAYKNGECYARGSQYGGLECVFDEKLKKYVIQPKNEEEYINAFKSEHRTQEYAQGAAQYYLNFLNNNIYTVKSQDGKDIPTQTGYALFIKQFSAVAKKLKSEKPELELINASFGGAQIDGFENEKLESIVSNLENVEKIDLSTYEANIDKDYVVAKLEKFEFILKDFKKQLEELISIDNKLIEKYEKNDILSSEFKYLFEKHKKTIDLIIDRSQIQETSFLITMLMYRAIDLLQLDFTQDANKIKETLKNQNGVLSAILEETMLYIDELGDCKSVIL